MIKQKKTIKQEKTDQSPEAVKKYCEAQGVTVTWKKVWGFVDETLLRLDPYHPPSEENAKAAAALLFEMMQAAKYNKKWEPYKNRLGVKARMVKGFDPEEVTIHDDAFILVLELLYKKRNQQETIKRFRKDIHPGSDSTIKRWIKEIEPRAMEMKKIQDRIEMMLDVKSKK